MDAPTPPVVINDINDLYALMLTVESDIKDHLPLLRDLASQCGHVTEFGVRGRENR